MNVESLRCEESSAQASRHQFALGHHARAQPFADFTHERDARCDLSQAFELFF